MEDRMMARREDANWGGKNKGRRGGNGRRGEEREGRKEGRGGGKEWREKE